MEPLTLPVPHILEPHLPPLKHIPHSKRIPVSLWAWQQGTPARWRPGAGWQSTGLRPGSYTQGLALPFVQGSAAQVHLGLCALGPAQYGAVPLSLTAVVLPASLAAT